MTDVGLSSAARRPLAPGRLVAAARAGLGGWRGPLLVAGLVCLLPFVWYEAGVLIQGADHRDPLNPSLEISRILSGWDLSHLGKPTFADAPRLFPYLTVWLVGTELGLSPGATQALWFAMIFALGFLSAAALVRELVPEERRRGPAVVVPVLAYLFNPFTMTSWAVGHTLALTAYAAAPLWIVFLLRALTRPTRATTGLAAAAVSLTFASAAVNPPIVMTLIGIPSVVVALSLLRSVRLRSLMARGALVVGWYVLLNAWWIVPFVVQGVLGTPFRYNGQSASVFEWPNLANAVPFSEFLRGFGYWGMYTGHAGVSYFSWASSMRSAPLVLASFGLAATVLVPLLRRRPGRWAIVAGSLFVVGVFFAKALNGPLGGVNRWMYENVPAFTLFRSAYEKFAGLLFLALLISLSLVVLRRMPGDRRRGLSAAVVTAAIAAISWPLWTGTVHTEPASARPGSRIEIPDSYGDLLRWTESVAETSTMLVVPQTPTGYVKTTWGYGGGGDPILSFSELPLLVGVPEARPEDGPQFASLHAAAGSFDRPALLHRLGIGFVLVRRDLDASYYPGTLEPAAVEARLRAAGYPLARQFGDLAVYEVPGSGGSLTVAHTALRPVSDADARLDPVRLTTEFPVVEGRPAAGYCVPRPVGLEVATGRIASTCGELGGDVTARAISFRLVAYSVRRVGDRAIVELDPVPASVRARGREATLAVPPMRFRIDLEEGTEVLRVGSQLLPLASESAVRGEARLAPGQPGVEVLRPAGEEMVRDGSFEAEPLSPGRRSVAFVRDATSGRRSLQLVAQNTQAEAARGVEGFEPGATYLITLDHRNLSGPVPSLGVWQAGTEAFAVDQLLPGGDSWQTRSIPFETSPTATSLHVLLYAHPAKGGSAARIDDIRLQRLESVSVLATGDELGAQPSASLGPVGNNVSITGGTPETVPIDGASFEQDLWDPGFLGTDPRGSAQTRPANDATDGSSSVEIAAKSGSGYVVRSLGEADADAVYRLDLDYRHVRGGPPSVAVFQTGPERFAYDEPLRTAPGWRHLSVTFRPDAGTNGLYLFLRSAAPLGGDSVNRFDDVRLTRVSLATELVLVQGEPSAPAHASVRLRGQDLAWTAQVNLTAPGGWVVLPQTFDDSWELRATTPDGRPVPVRSHVRGEGYANAWFVEADGPVVLHGRYARSSLPIVGLAVSLAALALASLLSARRREAAS